MRRNDAVDLATAAIRNYKRRGIPAIAVDYLQELTGNLWESRGFHEDVKEKVYRAHEIELVYAYESEALGQPVWAITPTNEIRRRYTWERLGQIETEFERVIARMGNGDRDVPNLLLENVRSLRKFVGCPDPMRVDDPVLDYARELTLASANQNGDGD